MTVIKGLIAEIGTQRWELPKMKANITGKDLKIIIKYLTEQNVETLYIKGLDQYINDDQTLSEMMIGNRDIFVGSIDETLINFHNNFNYNYNVIRINSNSKNNLNSDQKMDFNDDQNNIFK